MITEDYVSFETAKLLKEKGFDWELLSNAYLFKGNAYELAGKLIEADADIIIPTQATAMKWLREVHNIFIAINMIPDTIQKHYFFKPYLGGKIYNFPLEYSVEFYTIYEEAAEAAIKFCLKSLI